MKKLERLNLKRSTILNDVVFLEKYLRTALLKS